MASCNPKALNINFQVLSDLNKIQLVSSSVFKGSSPYIMLYNKAPKNSAFKIFGCLTYAPTTPQLRSKFSSKVTPSVFMGYPPNYNGYKLYSLMTKKCSFMKQQFPFASHSHQPTLDPFHSLVLPKPIHERLPTPTSQDDPYPTTNNSLATNQTQN
ncbi:hypothetical protein CR513_21505, partial [Mucuna pruriens]